MEAKCQCEAITLPLPGQPIKVYHCHCTECRRQSASAYGTSAVFPADAIFPIPDELRAKMGMWSRPADSGRTVDCYFCRGCGVRLFHRIIGVDGTPRETVTVKGGLVDGLDWKGATHIFTKSAVVPIPEGAEAFEAEPPVMAGRES